MTYTETALVFTNPFGHRTAGVLATPVLPTDTMVILCHGFLSDKNSQTNRQITDLLVARNIATLRFDWFGCGESDGDFAEITISICREQLLRVIADARARGYTRLGLIGSSFGGLIALLIAPHVSDVVALGLKCPVPDFPEMLRLRFGSSSMENWKNAGAIAIPVLDGIPPIRLQHRFYEDALTHNAYQAAHALSVPTFIVHGDRDQIVPVHQIHDLMRSLSGDRHLLLLAGADHQFARPNDFRKMTASLAEWMTRTLTTF
ncbi:MAG: alpha/beta fold hydrolase [Nitrospirae bacterium]|nr:MAG: alpha/beta fold hydrolase [Nitrospirota bacterium]